MVYKIKVNTHLPIKEKACPKQIPGTAYTLIEAALRRALDNMELSSSRCGEIRFKRFRVQSNCYWPGIWG